MFYHVAKDGRAFTSAKKIDPKEYAHYNLAVINAESPDDAATRYEIWLFFQKQFDEGNNISVDIDIS